MIGVLGARGNLGKRLIEAGYESVECNLLDENSMGTLNRFDVIINCAGKYDLTWCQENWVEALEINVFGLQRLLENYQGKLIHVSCDWFYDGKLGYYSETEKRSVAPFLTAVSANKYFQEVAIRQVRTKDYLIIRTSELYDVSTKNVLTLLKRIGDARPISGSQNIYFTPTYIPHLVLAIQNLVERKIDGEINVAGKDYCNEEAFNKMFCKLGNYDNFHTAGISHRQVLERFPRRLGLSTEKANNINIPLFTLEEGMKDLWTNLSKKQSSIL